MGKQNQEIETKPPPRLSPLVNPVAFPIAKKVNRARAPRTANALATPVCSRTRRKPQSVKRRRGSSWEPVHKTNENRPSREQTHISGEKNGKRNIIFKNAWYPVYVSSLEGKKMHPPGTVKGITKSKRTCWKMNHEWNGWRKKQKLGCFLTLFWRRQLLRSRTCKSSRCLWEAGENPKVLRVFVLTNYALILLPIHDTSPAVLCISSCSLTTSCFSTSTIRACQHPSPQPSELRQHGQMIPP